MMREVEPGGKDPGPSARGGAYGAREATVTDAPAPERPLRHLWAWLTAFGAMNLLAWQLGWPFFVV